MDWLIHNVPQPINAKALSPKYSYIPNKDSSSSSAKHTKSI